ncbi:DUF2336 domain-containing protein [Aestuariispira ectoiniformans]|uniref:DUF2336 domain-containing protein n=1 Tax=Aestuariispira ectoiniformans TaxID=2775080 RepID=UPI00223A9AA9|nr:DUF2336 domain-containing protein [Aestuariispira ectoiniformans]
MFQVSRDDIYRLSSNPSPEVRASIGRKVVSDYEADRYSGNERHLAETILKALSRDAETIVRSRLAWELRASERIPKDIALRLARDVEEVSLPILKYSPLLEPEDLLAIVDELNTEKNMVIASRKELPEEVSEALAETRDRLVVRVLLENETAIVSDNTLDVIDHYLGYDSRLRTLLDDKRAIKRSLSRVLVRKVAGSIKSKLMQRHEDEFPEYERMLWNDESQMADMLLSDSIENMDYNDLVQNLDVRGDLDANFAFMALDLGRADLFEVSVARMLKISRDELREVLVSGGIYGRTRLAQRLGLAQEKLDNFLANLENQYGQPKSVH